MPPKQKKGQSKPLSSKKIKENFDNYFTSIYNKRWNTSLLTALCSPSPKAALWNKYCNINEDIIISEYGLVPVSSIVGIRSNVYVTPICAESLRAAIVGEGDRLVEKGNDNNNNNNSSKIISKQTDLNNNNINNNNNNNTIPKPPLDDIGTPAYYLMDLASILITEQLQLESHHKVLDICAAPGGKSIAIGQYLDNNNIGELICNEADRERNARLGRNLKEYFPINTVNYNIVRRDGCLWHNPNVFDRVLVDVPCSSEGHLLRQMVGNNNNNSNLNNNNNNNNINGSMGVFDQWSPDAMGDIQLQLLLRGLETVKVGGIVVYSTCSISPKENDDIIRRALEKTRCGISIVEVPRASFNNNNNVNNNNVNNNNNSEDVNEVIVNTHNPHITSPTSSEKENKNEKEKKDEKENKDEKGVLLLPRETETQPFTSCTNIISILAEQTQYGRILLPDVSAGWGPMYCCTIRKDSEYREQDWPSDGESDGEEGDDSDSN